MAGLAKGYKGDKMGKDSIAEMIGTLFMSRTYAHMAHLKTGSYAEHKALDDFYSDIVGLADSLAEVAQGKYGTLDVPYVEMVGRVDMPIKALELHMGIFCDLAMDVSVGALRNIVDEVEALYLSTLYKLKELQ